MSTPGQGQRSRRTGAAGRRLPESIWVLSTECGASPEHCECRPSPQEQPPKYNVPPPRSLPAASVENASSTEVISRVGHTRPVTVVWRLRKAREPPWWPLTPAWRSCKEQDHLPSVGGPGLRTTRGHPNTHPPTPTLSVPFAFSESGGSVWCQDTLCAGPWGSLRLLRGPARPETSRVLTAERLSRLLSVHVQALLPSVGQGQAP